MKELQIIQFFYLRLVLNNNILVTAVDEIESSFNMLKIHSEIIMVHGPVSEQLVILVVHPLVKKLMV